MNRLLRIALVVSTLVCISVSTAKATCSTLPFTLTNGTLADATQVMANMNTNHNCATSVDSTQIGINGIWASQIKPDTLAHAIFGGSFGYQFGSGNSSQTQLTVAAPFLQTADILSVTLNAQQMFSVNDNGLTSAFAGLQAFSTLDANAPAVFYGNSPTQSAPLIQAYQNITGQEEFQIGANGVGLLNGPLELTNLNNLNGSAFVSIYSDGLGTTGILNVPAASPNGFQFRTANVVQAQVGKGGDGTIQCTPHGLATMTYCGIPMYTLAGTIQANTLHGVGPFTVTPTTNGLCANLTLCVLNSNAFTILTNGVFTSASTWSCFPTEQNLATLGYIFHVNATSGSGGFVGLFNASGSSIAASTSEPVTLVCIGI